MIKYRNDSDRVNVLAVKKNAKQNILLSHLPLGQDMTRGQFFKRSLTGLNSEFSFF